MSDNLAFLDRGEDEKPAADPVNVPPDATPQNAPEPEKPAEPGPETPEGEETEGEPEAGGNLGKALAAERAKRQDWKEKAIRAEEAAKARDAELAEMKRHVEDLRQRYMTPQPQPQPQPEQYIPDPMQDPRGFFQWQQAKIQQENLNSRLNLSEAYARDKHGTEKVDAAVQEFREAVQRNPALYQQMVQHPLPYEFVVQQGEALRLQREIGADPQGYRARIEAELREKLLAEMQGRAAPAPRVPNLPPSLAGSRSAMPRNYPIDADGDVSLGDILRRR